MVPAVRPVRGEVALIGHEQVLGAIEPRQAIDRVRDSFVRFARGEWTMPPKTYVQSPPNGDFRAMPALGSGFAILKWVTSFPGNPGRGLPTVTGIVLVSDADNGEPLALVDARAVTALRTGASAAVATELLARPGANSVGIVGCGLHGAWAARCLAELGFSEGICFDLDGDAAKGLADELGWRGGSLEDALACDVVTTVTPGKQPVIERGHIRSGMHINALGADGSGKAEMDVSAVAACRVFCDEWEQASHGGEITGAVQQGLLDRSSVTEIGSVLNGASGGRESEEDATLFDSTGLAIQDLAIVVALMDSLASGDLQPETVSL
ncbi:MAG TPA: ornithine cyclodeaminase family protein [Actinomycetota bacterium]|nr:ornithine cyclodeaminase family protein [Actinomycetota bacterium]